MKRRWLAWSRRRRALVIVAIAFLLVVPVPLGLHAASLRISYAGEPSSAARSRGHDAIWLGHAWVDGRKTPADVTALAKQFEGSGIRDLYVHTGPLEHDGSLPLATVAPKAAWFVDAVHRAMPNVRVQAWLGDVVLPQKNPGMDLDDAAVRDRVSAASSQVLDEGFDGIHFDLEPLQSGSKSFLALLDQVHALTKARGVPLSVAAAQLNPRPGMNGVLVALTGQSKWWSKQYFGQVAGRVEQIAVMSYDTAMPLESLYGGFVAQQTEMALAATPPGTDLLIGLPAYYENDMSHRGSAETVAAAVRGARLGLGNSTRQNFGLALYVDFAATPEHWAAYRDGWCLQD
jgi:hypothetical protein